MFSVLPSFIIFPIHLCLQIINLSFWAVLIITLGIIKLLIPLAFISRPINHILNFMLCAFGVISVRLIRFFNRIEIDVDIDGVLSKEHWYLMMPNHLSWLDIILLVDFAADRIPAPKFFLKKELIWLPFVGLGAWALDMPFMQRYSREFIEKNPHLNGKDIQTTKKSCEKFQTCPTTVINFVEGSRFTAQKHKHRNSPYMHLLPPKAGGIAFTLAAMGELFTGILDVTLMYPNNPNKPMLDMLSGRLSKVILRASVMPIEQEIIGDYFNDAYFKDSFQSWLNSRWAHKDTQINQLSGGK
ncbi:MAG: acyltransferase [Paraglaciecola polaris]|uniref:acyltransferase n=1 Tax=Paraglaciecola polaris TaxID=222814 RepID=UPI00300132D4|tara:strand:+ start:176 stop:1072 length:897 start_codon:yes stop_codon:yes gene_type:complete